VPIEELRPSARKLRKLDPAHVREVASSISLLGFCDPILIGRGNELIDGETRFEAAKQLGLDRIPCVRVEHLSPDEQRVLRLAANRLAEKGQWDLNALKIEFEELILLDAPIEIAGFSPAEIDHVILGDGPRRYQSGEVDYVGSISKCGDRRVRTLLYEAANVMLTRYKGQLKLKDGAFAIAQRATMCKAQVALARRPGIIMHAMLRDGTEFVSA